MSKRRRSRKHPSPAARPDRMPSEKDPKRRSAPGRGRPRTSSLLVSLGTAVLLCLIVAGLGSAAAYVWSGGWGQRVSPAAGGLPGTLERPAARIEASGRLLIPLGSGLSLVNLPDRGVTEVVRAGGSGAITGAQWAPDG